jgi:hypothetical protein
MKKKDCIQIFYIKDNFFFISVLDQCRGSVYLVLSTSKSAKAKNLKKIICCLHLEGSGSGYVQIKMDPDPGGPKTYGLDTQHGP